MGTHIEMSRTPGRVFPRGSTFQPGETSLALTVGDLLALDESLRGAGAEPKEIAMPKFVVTTIGALPRIVGKFLKWIGVQ